MNNLPKVRERKDRICKKHGNYYGYACDLCDKEYDLEELNTKIKEQSERLNEILGLPSRFKSARFSDFKTKTNEQRLIIAQVKRKINY